MNTSVISIVDPMQQQENRVPHYHYHHHHNNNNTVVDNVAAKPTTQKNHSIMHKDDAKLVVTTTLADSHDDDDEDAVACPICFSDQHLAVAPCQHVFCVPCLERILLSSGGTTESPIRQVGEFVSPEYPAGRDEDMDQLKIPAWNACPVCRQSLFLWDVKHVVGKEATTTTTLTTETDKETELHAKEQDTQSTPGNKTDTTTTTPSFTAGDYVYSRQAPNFGEINFLCSSVWLESSDGSPGRAGFGSFHFPPHADEPELTKAYYNVESVSHKRLFLQDVLYHAESRVLSARLVPEDEMSVEDIQASYRLVLAFSADGSFVRSGALVVTQPALTPSRHMAKFPYDGLYDFQEERVVVVGHKCIMNGQPLLLQKVFEVDEDYSESFGEDDHDLFPVSLLKLLTPNQRVVGTTACITGVGVGAQLV